MLELAICRQVLIEHDGQHHDGRQPQGQANEIDKGKAPVTEEIADSRA